MMGLLVRRYLAGRFFGGKVSHRFFKNDWFRSKTQYSIIPSFHHSMKQWKKEVPVKDL